jgi:hypothetical protein
MMSNMPNNLGCSVQVNLVANKFVFIFLWDCVDAIFVLLMTQKRSGGLCNPGHNLDMGSEFYCFLLQPVSKFMVQIAIVNPNFRACQDTLASLTDGWTASLLHLDWHCACFVKICLLRLQWLWNNDYDVTGLNLSYGRSSSTIMLCTACVLCSHEVPQ